MSCTYFPSQAQQLLTATSSAYTPTATDLFALFPFSINFLVACKNAGTSYTGVQSKFSVLYPFWGSVIGSQKFNYMNVANTDAAYRFTDVGGGTYNSNGYTANGSTQWLQTHYVHSTSGDGDLIGISLYERTNRGTGNNGVSFGGGTSTGSIQVYLGPELSSSLFSGDMETTAGIGFSGLTTTQGFWTIAKTSESGGAGSACHVKTYRNGSSLNDTTGTNAASLLAFQLFIGAINNGGASTTNKTPLQTCFGAIRNTNLSDAQETEFYNIASAFITALGR